MNAAERFAAVVTALWRLLPEPVRSWVPQTFIGLGLIAGFTFAVDLAILAVLYRGLGCNHQVAITIGYLVAFALSFVLNRWLNFQVHGPVTGQVARFVVVVAINYVVIILGIGTGLTEWFGVPFYVSRMVAGLAEALWMYVGYRWFVFASAESSTPPAR